MGCLVCIGEDSLLLIAKSWFIWFSYLLWSQICCSGLDEKLKVSSVVPLIVLGVISVFYGPGLRALPCCKAQWDEAVWRRPCGCLQSFSSFIKEPPKVEHLNDATDQIWCSSCFFSKVDAGLVSKEMSLFIYCHWNCVVVICSFSVTENSHVQTKNRFKIRFLFNTFEASLEHS